ncbi:MAG TPA: MFS transporter [Trebonia sp.]|jgi:MFS family permease
MAITDATAVSAWRPAIWRRSLSHYPNRVPRIAYLAIAVAATMVVYYELYVSGGVATLQLQHFHMSFGFYTLFIALSNIVSAFGALAAGLADRLGRVNLVVFGLLVGSLFVEVVIPNAPNATALAVETCVLGAVEGIVLVAAPALIRDFSPQVGRSTAMGFWLLGPIGGSFVVSVVATNTLPVLGSWQSQYYICGAIGLLTFLVGFLWLRELSPQLRDQLMVSERDRILVEARAKGINLEESLKHPWRQMARFRVIAPAFAYSIALLMYSTIAGFGTVYFTTVFGFSLSEANGVAIWGWVCDAILCIALGVVSDRLRIRKPFIVALGLLMALAIGMFIVITGGHPGFAAVSVVVGFLAGMIGAFSAPWLAAFTETVEDVNPALTATGLAIWGWFIRLCVGVAFLILPHVVHSVGGQATGSAAAQWNDWFWGCLIVALFVVPLTLVMKGRWTPSAARRDAEAHDLMLKDEIAALAPASEEV